MGIVLARERALLRRLAKGEMNLFWLLWKRHEPHLRRVCLRRMHPSAADAEDAMSRSMMLAREKLPDYADAILDLEAWLTRLACNVCCDLKKEHARRAAGAEAFDENALARREATLSYPPSPEDLCASRQIVESINRAIAELPPPLRDTARLRFLHEESYAAIATRLGIREANARKRVQQARMILTETLIPILDAS